MPEFILDEAGTIDLGGHILAFEDLDPFTRGYVEALFFTESDPSVSMVELAPDHEFIDGSIPSDSGFSDLHPESLASIIADCARFQETAAAMLVEAYATGDYSEEQAGRDFWYTRNGHGVGYWDRSELEPRGEWERLGRPRVDDSAWNEWAEIRAGSIGNRLSEAARGAGGRDVTFGAAADGAESPTGYGFVFHE